MRAANDAHLALVAQPTDAEPILEVFLGGWSNTKSVIRKNKQKPEKAEADTPDILNPTEFRGFWVRWSDNVVTVGREGEAAAILSYEDDSNVAVTHVGVCTGWGAAGSWIIDDPAGLTLPSAPAGSTFGGSPCWIAAAGGEIPPEAVVGGQDGEAMYVARARHEGALLPGKLLVSHGVAYVPWGGAEHPHEEYEVLCGCSATWSPVQGGDVPANALPGGETEDGEPLFVGRVQHEGSVTLGKVQASHGTCYIPYAGQELAFQEYEVLVSSS